MSTFLMLITKVYFSSISKINKGDFFYFLCYLQPPKWLYRCGSEIFSHPQKSLFVSLSLIIII